MKLHNKIFYILFIFWQSNLYSQQNEEINNKNLSKLIIKTHSWSIDTDITKLKKNDSTFMMSNQGDEKMWKYVDKKTHYEMNGDIRFTKNGKVIQLLRNNYSGKEIKVWKEVGSYTVSDSILNIFCLNQVIKLNCKILSKNVIELKVINEIY